MPMMMMMAMMMVVFYDNDRRRSKWTDWKRLVRNLIGRYYFSMMMMVMRSRLATTHYFRKCHPQTKEAELKKLRIR